MPKAETPETTEELIQLATRIPKRLHRRIKLYCVKADETVMEFVTAALEARIKRVTEK